MLLLPAEYAGQNGGWNGSMDCVRENHAAQIPCGRITSFCSCCQRSQQSLNLREGCGSYTFKLSCAHFMDCRICSTKKTPGRDLLQFTLDSNPNFDKTQKTFEKTRQNTDIISLSHTKENLFVRFCIMPWKDEREPTTKLCMGRQFDVVQKSSSEYRALDKIDGEPMEFEWNIFPGFITLQLVREVQEFLSKLSIQREDVT